MLWDKRHDRFHRGLDDQGRVSSFYGDRKYLYGISFCIYAAAAVAHAANDERLWRWRSRGFAGSTSMPMTSGMGGVESLTREGTPLHADPTSARVAKAEVSFFPIGFKSANTHLHLLESFTQLYQVWRDGTLRLRLKELFEVLRDRAFVEPEQ